MNSSQTQKIRCNVTVKKYIKVQHRYITLDCIELLIEKIYERS